MYVELKPRILTLTKSFPQTVGGNRQTEENDQ